MNTAVEGDTHVAASNRRVAAMTGSIAFIALFTALSGLGDAEGFIHASKVWQEGRFVWIEALKCIAGFQFGMLMYWLALWKLSSNGVVAVEIQTLFWFAATIVGVALLSGRILRWPAIDKAVAVAVLTGIGWLLCRGGRGP
jgi:hypothetical protein